MPPTPEEQTKKEVNRYEVLVEAKQLLCRSLTPSGAGSRFGVMGDEEKKNINKMAIVVSENEPDEVKKGRESDKEEDYLDYSKLDFSFWRTLPPAPRFKINVLPPANFRSTANEKWIDGLMKESEELKTWLQTTLNGCVKHLEMNIAVMAEEVKSLNRAVAVTETDAARVKKMNYNHEAF